MAQQRITFEWVMEERPFDNWSELGQNSNQRVNVAVGEQMLSIYLVRIVALVLVALGASAAAGLSAEERLRREAENGIAFTVSLESQAWRIRDWDRYLSHIDPDVDEEWVSEWREVWRDGADDARDYQIRVVDVQLAGDFIQATVVADYQSSDWEQTGPYREERFYRRLGQEWVRTVPPVSHWGEQRYLELDHLRFQYYARDAEVVETAAAELDSAYAGMYETLGIERPQTDKLLVSVVPEPVQRWNASGEGLEVTSPSLETIPVGQSESGYLAYRVMNWFTYRAIRDATPNSAARYLYRWPILVWGLRGWLREDLLQPQSPWRTEALEVLHESDQLPFALHNVTELRGDDRPSREEVIIRYLAAESFVSFIVDTYGRDHLPDFMGTIVRYGSWPDIISRLYGHSVEKFVTDWNIYVMEHYAVE